MNVLDKISIKDLVCLEAGTGAGNTTIYLAKNGAKMVYSISDNVEHLEYASERLPEEYRDRVKFIKADLGNLGFMKEEMVDLVTAHMLINVVAPADLFLIFKELTRVTKTSGVMVVNDYNPLSSYCEERSWIVEELFRIENAVSYIVNGAPAMVWYPSEYVTELLKLLGWNIEGIEYMYEKTPWEKELLKEHLQVIEEGCVKLEDEGIRKSLLSRAKAILEQVGDKEVIYAGSIYSIKAKKEG